MDSAATLENAQIHIAQVLQADSKDSMRMLATYARAWIACLYAEGLISQVQFILLDAQLNDAVSNALVRLDQLTLANSEPSHDDSDYAP